MESTSAVQSWTRIPGSHQNKSGKRNQAHMPELAVEMLAFTRLHSPYTEIIYIRGGKRALKCEWSPTAGGRALRQTRAEKTNCQINLPLATIKTAARTHFTGMYDLPVSKQMGKSFGNASVANCTFGKVSWQCSLFKLCQSSSKCDNVIRRSCQGIMAKHTFAVGFAVPVGSSSEADRCKAPLKVALHLVLEGKRQADNLAWS